jgi:hypothetical protein
MMKNIDVLQSIVVNHVFYERCSLDHLYKSWLFPFKENQTQQEMFSTTLLETSTCIPPLWWKLQLSIFFIEPTNNLVNNKSKANG